jgi:hypothetical protein
MKQSTTYETEVVTGTQTADYPQQWAVAMFQSLSLALHISSRQGIHNNGKLP